MEPPQLFQAFLLWLGQLLLPGGHKEAFKLLSKPFLMSSHPFTSMSSSLSLPAINPFKIFWAIPNFYWFGVRVWLSVQGLHLGSVSLELSFCYKYTKAETKANKKDIDNLTSCAHLRLNNKKKKNKLFQNGPREWTLILDKKWFDQFSRHFTSFP